MENNPQLNNQNVNHSPNKVHSAPDMRDSGKQKNMYVLSLDGSRIFWILSIVLLLMTFVLLLGYWIGSDAAMSSMNANISTARQGRIHKQKPNPTAQSKLETKAKISEENMDNKAQKTTTEKSEVAQKENAASKQENVKFSKGEETVFNPDTGKVYTPKENTSTKQRISRSIKMLKTRRGVDTYGSDKYMTRSKPYSIQIATHFALKTAMYVKRKLRRKNHSAYIFMHKSSSGKRFYKIRVGTFTSRPKARNYLSMLKNRTRYGHGAIIVHR